MSDATTLLHNYLIDTNAEAIAEGVSARVYPASAQYTKELNDRRRVDARTRYVIKQMKEGTTVEFTNEYFAARVLQGVPGIMVACDSNYVLDGKACAPDNTWDKDYKYFSGKYCNAAYLTFEEMNGTLLQYLQKYPELKLEQRLDLGLQLSHALKNLVLKGYRHNDLHVGNILYKEYVGGKVELYVSDFGHISNEKQLVTKIINDWDRFLTDLALILIPNGEKMTALCVPQNVTDPEQAIQSIIGFSEQLIEALYGPTVSLFFQKNNGGINNLDAITSQIEGKKDNAITKAIDRMRLS